MTVAVDRCHGDQTVDRSELWAMVKLHERWTHTTLVTDSEYVRSSLQLVTSVSNEGQLIFRSNAKCGSLDSTSRLRRAQHEAAHTVIKLLQSHTLEGNKPRTTQSFCHTLRSMVADRVAKQGNQQRCPQSVGSSIKDVESPHCGHSYFPDVANLTPCLS